METAQQEQTITLADLVKYLQLYTDPDVDWLTVINNVGKSIPKDELRQRIAFTILLPVHEKYALKNTSLESFMMFCHKWNQYNTRQWWDDLQKVIAQDNKIKTIRDKCLALGVIDPIQFNPITRQARNWLINEADNSGDLTDTNRDYISKRLENLVYAYGGNVICGIFTKPEWKPQLSKLHNWRSGYFFERLIHRVYTNPEDVIKIKTQELNKLRSADSKLVKSIRQKDSGMG